jgi:hypothetical protein
LDARLKEVIDMQPPNRAWIYPTLV